MKKIAKVPIQNQYISKELFYKRCHISKGTALKLIKSGLIPVSKGLTGYLIAVEDVKRYLINRENNPKQYGYCGTLNGQFRQPLSPSALRAVVNFFEDKPDIFSVEDISGMFGCHPSNISKWKQRFGLKAIMLQHKLYVPKDALIDFIASSQFQKIVPGDTEESFLRQLIMLLLLRITIIRTLTHILKSCYNLGAR